MKKQDRFKMIEIGAPAPPLQTEKPRLSEMDFDSHVSGVLRDQRRNTENAIAILRKIIAWAVPVVICIVLAAHGIGAFAFVVEQTWLALLYGVLPIALFYWLLRKDW